MEAVARKIPMLTRAELLGQLMKNYKTPIAVSGIMDVVVVFP